MKKMIIAVVTIVLLMSLSACGSKTTPTAGVDDASKDAATQSKEDEAFDEAMTSLVDADHSTWPKEIVQPDMPVYTAGKLNGWNQWDSNNDYNIFILIEDTSKADLEKYIIDLKAAGFEEKNSDTFHKGIYDVVLQFNGDNSLQISSKKEKTLEWPEALLIGVPELKKGALTGIIEPNADMPDYVQLYIINLTKEDLLVWLKDLEVSGFSVEGENASKDNVELKGKTYKSLSVQFQENGSGEWMVDFNYNEE